jgi:hypothetical protein
MLNYSDDGAGRPEKATLLWKWVMQYIQNKKKEEEKNVSIIYIVHMYMCIRNCWTEMLARSLGHIIILVHFRSKR